MVSLSVGQQRPFQHLSDHMSDADMKRLETVRLHIENATYNILKNLGFRERDALRIAKETEESVAVKIIDIYEI